MPVLLLLTLGLVSLGMKLPTFPGLSSTSGKPKPRPRAVIQNQIKNCNTAIKKLSQPAAATVRVVVAHPPVLAHPIYENRFISHHFADFVANGFSRAPPLFS